MRDLNHSGTQAIMAACTDFGSQVGDTFSSSRAGYQQNSEHYIRAAMVEREQYS